MWSVSDRVPPFLAPSRRTEKTSSLSSSWSCNDVKVKFFSLLPSRYIRYPDIGVTSNCAGVWYISFISLKQQKNFSHNKLHQNEKQSWSKIFRNFLKSLFMQCIYVPVLKPSGVDPDILEVTNEPLCTRGLGSHQHHSICINQGLRSNKPIKVKKPSIFYVITVCKVSSLFICKC